MKLNYVVPVICAILLGYLCASFIFNQYGIDSLVFNEKASFYYLQCGAYNSKAASDKDFKDILHITVEEDNKYYSYIGMTADIDVAKKIKKLYEDKDIDIYIKESYLGKTDFVNQLIQYDVLLESTKSIEEVNSVLKTVLATYDEIVLNQGWFCIGFGDNMHEV